MDNEQLNKLRVSNQALLVIWSYLIRQLYRVNICRYIEAALLSLLNQHAGKVLLMECTSSNTTYLTSFRKILLFRRKEPTPTVLGHEGCGTVALSKRSWWSWHNDAFAVDAGNDHDINNHDRPDAPVGMRLTFSVTDVCHDCQVCRGGPPQKCLNLKK